MNLPPGFWDGVLRRLEAAVPPHLLELWVAPLAVENDGEELRLGCPTPFHRERVRDRFLDAIVRAVSEEAGRSLEISLEVGARRKPAPNPGRSTPRAPRPAEARPPGPPACRTREARDVRARQYTLPHTFDTFVVGECNALAREAAIAVAQGRQRRANPLFLVGEIGLGKTHLARATAAEARAHGAERIVYASAESFTNAFTHAIRKGETEGFRRRFRGCQLLVVDDVQFLRSKAATQLELFHTLTHVVDAGGRVVLTGERMPRDMEGIESRLRSQLAAGLVAELESPDAAVRRQILRSKASSGGVRLPDDCLDLLVEHVRGSVRDLESVLIQLVESAALLKRSIDRNLTLVALRKLAPVASSPRRLEVGAVLRVVAGYFKTSPAAMASRSRRRDVLLPRQLAMYLCRRYTDASLGEIAAAFDRKHPAVSNAVEAIERAILKRAPLRYQVEALAERLEALQQR